MNNLPKQKSAECTQVDITSIYTFDMSNANIVKMSATNLAWRYCQPYVESRDDIHYTLQKYGTQFGNSNSDSEKLKLDTLFRNGFTE